MNQIQNESYFFIYKYKKITMNRKITLEQEKQIIDLYKNKSQKNIGKLFGMTQGGVRKVLKRNHIIKLKNSRLNMSKLSLDVDFFKNVDSNEKAYWFGYIAADGSINKKNNKVTLVSKDKEIIEKFKICIKSDHKISETNVFDKRTKKRYRGFTIQIGNEIFTNNLINKGLTNLKSKKFNFPNIDDKYYSYLIAGLFDGDGCISFRRCKFKNKSRINLISTLENLVTIQNYLLNKIYFTVLF